jgi:hypothetical protein
MRYGKVLERKILSWENAVFTVLGGLIAGFSGILVEWWRENRKLRDRHFEDIKRRCLEPILKRLYDLKGNFVFGESGPEWTGSYEIEKLLASDVHWWESFSFKDGFGADALLYEDLKNHYPDLYRDLQNIEKRLRAGYTEYLQAVYELLKIIEDDQEFRAFEKKFERPILNFTSSYPAKAVIFLALGVDKSNWPNIYSYVKPKLDEAKRLQNKFYNNVEAQKVRTIINDMTTAIDKCIVKAREIILETKLKGKCKYIRGI